MVPYHAIVSWWIEATWLRVKDGALGAPDTGKYSRPYGFAALFRKEHIFLEWLHARSPVDRYHDVYKKRVSVIS